MSTRFAGMTVKRGIGQGFGFGIGCLLLVVACSEPAESGKFDQTWAKSYDDTSCLDWRSEMNDHERFVMSADYLLTLRKRDGDETIPPDSMIASFESGVDSICYAEFGDLGGLVGNAATLWYTTEVTYHP